MATGVFILAVIAGILIFFECVQRAVQVNSQNTLKINVQRQSEHLRTILDINYQYLNEIASAMGKSEELFSEENKEQLISIYEKTDLERAALIDKNGDAYYDNGVTKNVSHRRYFQEAISGEQTISDPLESSVDHKVRVVLGVPVYKDHKVIGVLGGSCNVTALSHMLFNDLFDGAGNSLLATSDGEIIAFDSGSASGTEITYGINLFKYYGEKNLKGKHALQDIQEDFKVGESGLVKFSLKERKEEDRYLAYMPLGYNDWMICYAIPVKSAQQAYEFISGLEWEALMSLGFRNFLNDRSVYDNQESYGHDQRNDLRNGERPPYCVKSADGSKDISSRYQDKQLTHDRYDHTEYSFSECLEYSSRNDTEPCDQIVDSYDTKCRDSDGKHIFGSTEQPQQCFRNKFKGKKTNECKTECDEHADFDSFKHTLSVACTIIIGNDRCNAVVKSKYRHEEKTL